MKNRMEVELLTHDELMTIDGGRITTDSSLGEDVGYVLGVMFRCYYDFVTGAASFQSSLSPSLKK